MERPRDDGNTDNDDNNTGTCMDMANAGNATDAANAIAANASASLDTDTSTSTDMDTRATNADGMEAKKRKRTHKEQGRSKNRALAGDIKPQKKFYRSRAHCNPLSHNNSFNYPVSPDDMRWDNHFPIPLSTATATAAAAAADGVAAGPDFVDMGCGFGGLTVALATAFPDRLTLGMEIRAKVVEYVHLRILSLRKANPGMVSNMIYYPEELR